MNYGEGRVSGYAEAGVYPVKPPTQGPSNGMRVLFTIPHYFANHPAAAYASERGDVASRTWIVRACLASLQQNFAEGQGLLEAHTRSHAANSRLSASLDIVVCTTGDRHLVGQLGAGFTHVSTKAAPRQLGFECHKLLRDGLGRYDYFVYLEDDLRVADPLLFAKLAWFTEEFGNDALLQPNRFELTADRSPYKLYIDGNLSDPRASHQLQHVADRKELRAQLFRRPFVFKRVVNPHSGCFFLNEAQMAHWASQPDFAEPDDRFCGPLESAATLGIMRYFRTYKPARENAGFLEIEHLDPRYLGHQLHAIGDQRAVLHWN